MSKETIPKRHHYIPEFLQAYFADKSGHIYTFDCNISHKQVRQEQPKNIFVKGHEYSSYEEDGSRNPSLERRFARLEQTWKPVVDKVVTSFATGNPPLLSADERGLWNEFFIYQWRRVPDLRKRILPLEQHASRIASFIDEYDKLFGPVSKEARKHFLSPDYAKTSHQNIHVRALQGDTPRVSRALQGRGLLFGVPHRNNKSFILGSQPIAKLMPRRGSTMLDPDSQAWLPVAPRLAVSPGNVGPDRVMLLPDNEVRYLNEAIAKQSTVIAGISRPLIESLQQHVGSNLGSTE